MRGYTIVQFFPSKDLEICLNVGSLVIKRRFSGYTEKDAVSTFETELSGLQQLPAFVLESLNCNFE